MFPGPDTGQIQKHVQTFYCLQAVCQSDYYFILSGGSNESLMPDRPLFSMPLLNTCIPTKILQSLYSYIYPEFEEHLNILH